MDFVGHKMGSGHGDPKGAPKASGKKGLTD